VPLCSPLDFIFENRSIPDLITQAMPELPEFECQWPDEPNGPNGLYYPDDIEDRIPHPDTVPQGVLDVITRLKAASTYAVYNNSDATFTLFPKLPVELRRIIWRHSLPGTRVVAVFCDAYDQAPSFRSTTPVPTILHVSSEARMVALRYYELRFAVSTTPALPARTYFDSEIDSLYLGVGNFHPSGNDAIASFIRLLQPRDLNSIKNLIMDATIETIYPDEEYNQPGLMSLGLKNIESITIVGKTKKSEKDMVLQKSESQIGEFQAWKFNKDGKPSPWFLPKEATPREGDISAFWADLEENSFEESPSIQTLAFVSWNTLRKIPRWAGRVKFLQKTVFAQELGCLYQKDGVVNRLVGLDEDPNQARYDELEDIINVGLEGSTRLDPIDVYLCQKACVCAIRHHQQRLPPAGLSDDFIATIDLKKALEMLDLNQ